MELVIILSRILIGLLPFVVKIEANDPFPIDQQPQPQKQQQQQQLQFQQQQNRLIQLFQLQCFRPPPSSSSSSSAAGQVQFRPITIRQLMNLFNQCARPHLINTDFITKDVYPLRFDQMIQQCLNHKLNPEWNICQPFVLESMLYCLVEQDLSLVLKAQLIFRFHRESAYRLAHLILNDCSHLLENVWQQQQQQESKLSKSWNETSFENIDLPEHKMVTI